MMGHGSWLFFVYLFFEFLDYGCKYLEDTSHIVIQRVEGFICEITIGMKQIEPVVCLVCFFVRNTVFVQKVCIWLGVLGLSRVSTYTRPWPLHLLRHHKLLVGRVFRQRLIKSGDATSKIETQIQNARILLLFLGHKRCEFSYLLWLLSVLCLFHKLFFVKGQRVLVTNVLEHDSWPMTHYPWPMTLGSWLIIQQ